jgi:hypothetical protein
MWMIEQNGVWSCSKHGAFPDFKTDYTSRSNSDNDAWPHCPTCVDIQDKDLCRFCEKHPAKLNYSDSVMAHIHGFSIRICQCCYVAQIEKTLAATITTLSIAKEELNAHPCDPFEPDPA